MIFDYYSLSFIRTAGVSPFIKRSLPYSTILLASLRETADAKFCLNEAGSRTKAQPFSRPKGVTEFFASSRF